MKMRYLKNILPIGLLCALLVLNACGYHLVGQGSDGGAIPADVSTISVTGNAKPALLSLLRQRLQSDRYSIVGANAVNDQTRHVTVYINMAPLVFTPSAYDRSGLATQYRMTFTGSLRVDRNGDTLWQSGPVQRQGDVFVTGGPTSIEASRQRLEKDLRKQWLGDAVGRLRSGF